jgi:hypothetical protein
MTKTKTKAKKFSRVTNDGTGTSKSYHKLIHPVPKKMKVIKWACNTQIVDYLNPYIIDTMSSGVQKVSSTTVMYDSSNIQGQYNSFIGQQLGSSGSAAAQPVGSFVGTQKTMKLYLQSAVKYLTFTNVTNANITVDIYDLVAKRDRGSYVAPETDWNNGCGDASGSTGLGYASNSICYTGPEASKLFTQFWTIKRKTHVEMGQGRSHEHIWSYGINKQLELERTTASSILAGITAVSMLVVRGLPNITATTSAATTNEAKIAIIDRVQFKYRIITTLPGLFRDSNAAVLSVVTTNVVNEGSGAIGLYAEET